MNVDVRLVIVMVVLVVLSDFVGWMSRSAGTNPLDYGVKRLDWCINFQEHHRASLL